MLAAERSRLIFRSVAQVAQLDPVTIVFPGKAPVAGARRISTIAGSLREAGLSAPAPAVFLLDRAVIPLGITIAPELRFVVGSDHYSVSDVDSQPGEPQVRFTARLTKRA